MDLKQAIKEASAIVEREQMTAYLFRTRHLPSGHVRQADLPEAQEGYNFRFSSPVENVEIALFQTTHMVCPAYGSQKGVKVFEVSVKEAA